MRRRDRTTFTDEELDELGSYFVSEGLFYSRGVNFEQFIYHPDLFGYEVPISEIEEMECCF